MSRNPVVFAKDNTPYGDAPQELLQDPSRTICEIPGYSDVRRENELAAARGERTRPLPYRFHIARATRIDNSADRRDIAAKENDGYRVLQWDEAKKYGIDLSNTAFIRAPDGTCRYLDGVLMVTDAKHAAANYARQRAATNRAVEGLTATRTDASGKHVLTATETTVEAK